MRLRSYGNACADVQRIPFLTPITTRLVEPNPALWSHHNICDDDCTCARCESEGEQDVAARNLQEARRG